jgi:hypothetical protein
MTVETSIVVVADINSFRGCSEPGRRLDQTAQGDAAMV